MSLDELLVVRALRDPQGVLLLDAVRWGGLLGQARAVGVLARISARIRDAGVWEKIPLSVQRHLRAAEVLVARQHDQTLFEIGEICRALKHLNVPIVLLKGAAYIAAKHPAAQGRLLSDLDIMVPKSVIGAAESALMLAGWVGAKKNPYDQRYYREWMHEIPPMEHIRRGTVIDLHHTILPPTARPDLDAEQLFKEACPIAGWPMVYTLSAEDQVLHSVAHLFYDGDFTRGLRDVGDIASLIEAGCANSDGFSARLCDRAEKLGLLRELGWAAFYVRTLLQGRALNLPKPTRLRRTLFSWALMPKTADCGSVRSAMARGSIYVRSHWLRMPLHLAGPHLIRKVWGKACDW